MDLEPFPRAKIMKLCYIILDKVKAAPEDSMYRIYTEEKIKYIMRNTDANTSIRSLEELFGTLRSGEEREKERNGRIWFFLDITFEEPIFVVVVASNRNKISNECKSYFY